MRLISLALIALFINGCMGATYQTKGPSPNLKQNKASCESMYRSDYSKQLNCRKARHKADVNRWLPNWRSNELVTDYLNLYWSYIDAVDERYKRDLITKSEGDFQIERLRMRLKGELDEIERQSNYAKSQASINMMMLGLGVYYSSQADYTSSTGLPSSTIYNIRGDSIICTKLSNNFITCN